MKIVVVTDDLLKMEISNELTFTGADIHFTKDLSEAGDSDVCIDLLFENNNQRIGLLNDLKNSMIIINSVSGNNIPPHYIRLNGWPTLLRRPVAEVAKNKHHSQSKIETIFDYFSKKTEWVPDIPGMITPRIISMIINEAYFALGEGVSQKEEIDIAMKLGTNYPYGPFEWSEKIGLKKIYSLLEELSVHEKRYSPAPLLKQQAFH